MPLEISVSPLRFLPFEMKNFGAVRINELRHNNNKSTSIRSV
jgi:hypothetical protein